MLHGYFQSTAWQSVSHRPRHHIILSATSQPPHEPPPITYLLLDLPLPSFTKVKSASFIKSSPNVTSCPPDRDPEFALIGRSNVGKSSLINMLTESKSLAKVSKEPGMTKLINHYLINDSWYLVDLPGYGFAKTASKDSRDGWLQFTKDFFINRNNLVHVLLLVDASLPPQQVDCDCANWLAECEVPFAVCFTKIDSDKKVAGRSSAKNIRAFKELLAKDWEAIPWCFETSSKEGKGKSEVLGYLASLRDLHLKQK